MRKHLILLLLTLAASGCSQAQLVRLAPPGIIKYEEIAGDKPPNPAIQELIDNRAETVDAKFPKIAETPSRKDQPIAPPKDIIAAEISELAARRDAVTSNITEDRAAVAAERGNISDLDLRRDTLAEELKRDEAAAKRERQENK